MIDNLYLERVVEWAQAQDEIRAVVVTGSLSRQDGSTDEWSDLDVQLICRELTPYLLGHGWLDNLGTVWIHFPLDEQNHYRLVWFEGGKKVDFQLTTTEPIRQMITSGQLSDEYQRGYIVALDKDKLYHALPPSPHIFPQPQPPTPEAVHDIINEFWFESIHVAQFIRRREFWVVKFRDWTMKCDLLQMMEWHTRSHHDEPINTWVIGKRIEQWTDDQTRQSLHQLWGGWDAPSSWDSLLTMLDVFSRLSQETTTKLGYPYRAETYQQIHDYIKNLHDTDTL